MYGFATLPYLYRARLAGRRYPSAADDPDFQAATRQTGTGTLEEPEVVRLHRRFGVPQSYGGERVTADDARRAQGQALVSAGSALLRGISENNMAGGLADAFESYSGGITGVLERRRQMLREQQADERLTTAAEDSHLGAMKNLQMDDAQLAAAARAVKEKDDDDRRKKAMVDALASSIGTTSGDPTSPEARRAAALALAGQDADVGALLRTDEIAAGRGRILSDAEMEARAKAAQNKIYGAEGYGPIVESQRDAERLRLDRARLALESRRISNYEANGMGAAGRAPTANQVNDDVKAEGDVLFRAWLGQQPKVQENKWINGAIRTLTPPTEAEISAARQRAMDEAEKSVFQRYGLATSHRGADGSFAPGVYVYDPKTGRMVKQ